MPSKDTQFKPGQSGNPRGKPKGTVSLVTTLKRKLREDPKRADELVENLLGLAMGGDAVALGALKTLLDRIDGAVTKKQEINVSGDRVKLVRLEGDEDDEPGGDDAEESG